MPNDSRDAIKCISPQSSIFYIPFSLSLLHISRFDMTANFDWVVKLQKKKKNYVNNL